MRYARLSRLGYFLLLAMTFSACATVQNTALQIPERKVQPAEPTKPNLAKAMRYFVSGALYEAKEQFSQAILEYQDALRYAPNEAAIYFSLAKCYQRLGKLDQAIQAAQKATSLDSTNKWYDHLLAQIYFEAQQYDASAATLERFLSKAPHDVNALYMLAAAHTASEKYDKAIEVYDRILKVSGTDLEALYKKLLLQLQLKRDDEATLTLLQMIVIDPTNDDLYYMLAEIYLKSARYEEALATYDEIAERTPHEPRLFAGYSEVYIRQRDWKRFEAIVEKMFEHSSRTKEERMTLAEAYLSRAAKDTLFLKPAEIVLTKVQKLYPKEWKPYWFLGIVHIEQHNLAQAIENFKQLTVLRPDMIAGWENLGIAYLQKNEIEQAILTFKLALKRQPQPTFRLQMLLGIALSQANRDREAVDVLEAALQSTDQGTSAERVQAYSTLGIAYDRLGRPEDSQRSYEAALKLDPENALVLNNLAYSLAERNQQLERCLEMAKLAVQKEPNNGAYLDTIGWVYFKLGNYEEARIWIEKALSAGRESPAVLEHLGDVYHKLGKPDKAREFWQRALQMNSSSVSLREKVSGARMP
ncbi:MAG: tetratricopeptide repeat protein [Chloroherpetonaceae bacterium]|nr:tetratricopeptide repeat protein [Chloroherpetonaceae bacterium]MDW8018585.1 tetratricopeptide repeat protein [Chloroherpetonaceae bacterium]